MLEDKYLFFVIQNHETPMVYVKETYDDALSAFHTELGYRHETRFSTICIIMDMNGNEIMRDQYERMVETE